MPALDGSAALDLAGLLQSAPIIPVLVIERPDTGVALAEALYEAGMVAIEVTLRTPQALRVIEAIAARLPRLVVGAGTVLDADALRAAAEAGARFAACPGSPESLLRAASDQRMALLPGVSTATEVMCARELGYPLQKFFPAKACGGVATLRAFRGPLPDIRFCPTGGIDREQLVHYLREPNVLAVGGSWLAPARLVADRDWQAIRDRARTDLASARLCAPGYALPTHEG